jgi:hypothetical protein
MIVLKGCSAAGAGTNPPHRSVHPIASSIPEFRSAGHATDTGLLFESAGVALAQDWSVELMKRRRTPNELMPCAASSCHRDQLVAGLEALQTFVPDAGKCAADTSFNPSQPAPAIEPPIGRRCARAAKHPLGGSYQPRGIGVSTFDLADDGRESRRHGRHFLWPAHRWGLRPIWISHTSRPYGACRIGCRLPDVGHRDLAEPTLPGERKSARPGNGAARRPLQGIHWRGTEGIR